MAVSTYNVKSGRLNRRDDMDDWKCPKCGTVSPQAGGAERAIDRLSAVMREGLTLIATAHIPVRGTEEYECLVKSIVAFRNKEG